MTSRQVKNKFSNQAKEVDVNTIYPTNQSLNASLTEMTKQHYAAPEEDVYPRPLPSDDLKRLMAAPLKWPHKLLATAELQRSASVKNPGKIYVGKHNGGNNGEMYCWLDNPQTFGQWSLMKLNKEEAAAKQMLASFGGVDFFILLFFHPFNKACF